MRLCRSYIIREFNYFALYLSSINVLIGCNLISLDVTKSDLGRHINRLCVIIIICILKAVNTYS
jgi:hypothetical protein